MLKIDKDTAIYCSFSTNPGNNGCEFFNKQFQIYKLNAIYKSFRSESIKESIEAVKALDIKGFALGMPFKIHVLDYLNEVDNTVKKIGSVNTVINNKGILKGYNTDWIGVKKFFELSNFKSIFTKFRSSKCLVFSNSLNFSLILWFARRTLSFSK